MGITSEILGMFSNNLEELNNLLLAMYADKFEAPRHLSDDTKERFSLIMAKIEDRVFGSLLEGYPEIKEYCDQGKGQINLSHETNDLIRTAVTVLMLDFTVNNGIEGKWKGKQPHEILDIMANTEGAELYVVGDNGEKVRLDKTIQNKEKFH